MELERLVLNQWIYVVTNEVVDLQLVNEADTIAMVTQRGSFKEVTRQEKFSDESRT